MAEAPPPPLQMDAIPKDLFFALRELIKVKMILFPLTPIGWPSATAPPLIHERMHWAEGRNLNEDFQVLEWFNHFMK